MCFYTKKLFTGIYDLFYYDGCKKSFEFKENQGAIIIIPNILEIINTNNAEVNNSILCNKGEKSSFSECEV